MEGSGVDGTRFVKSSRGLAPLPMRSWPQIGATILLDSMDAYALSASRIGLLRVVKFSELVVSQVKYVLSQVKYKDCSNMWVGHTMRCYYQSVENPYQAKFFVCYM